MVYIICSVGVLGELRLPTIGRGGDLVVGEAVPGTCDLCVDSELVRPATFLSARPKVPQTELVASTVVKECQLYLFEINDSYA